jgi:hypothetical protein
MDVSTAYLTILSTVLAVETLVLLPCFLLAAILPPDEIEAEFPPPPGYSGTENRTVDVPEYPSSLNFLSLIAIYVFDIIMIYPYTQNGLVIEHSILYQLIGIVSLTFQAMAAVGWSGIKTSWLAAEKGYALWYSKAWTCYYMSFILTGVAIGLPLLYKGIWFVIDFTIAIAPTSWIAIYNAYAPLKFW